MEILIQRGLLDAFEVFIMERDPISREVSVVKSLEVETVELARAHATHPLFALDDQGAQSLMDTLYRAGVRPSDAEDGTGTKLHLADMRKIVSAKLEVEL